MKNLLLRGFIISLTMTLIALPIAWTCVGIWGQRGLFVSYPTTLAIGTLMNAAVHTFGKKAG